MEEKNSFSNTNLLKYVSAIIVKEPCVTNLDYCPEGQIFDIAIIGLKNYYYEFNENTKAIINIAT